MTAGWLAALCTCAVLSTHTPAPKPDLAEWRRLAFELLEAEEFADAIPLLEQILASDPHDADANFNLGFSLASIAQTLEDDSARRRLRVRARTVLLKSLELGLDRPSADVILDSLPPDGADRARLSISSEADALMAEGERFFSEKRLDEALNRYAQALQLDPGLYEAALYSGDVFLQRKDFARAEAWYQRAVAINPLRETAYRYSATALMRQNRLLDARDRYVEAYISEPYNRMASGGLRSWMEHAEATIVHPDIAIPTRVILGPNGTFDSAIDHERLTGKQAAAWTAYDVTRAAWRDVRFAEAFPGKTAYRHTLAEEADALRAVVNLAVRSADGEVDPTIEAIRRLDEEHLLEPYILLARSNESIARDHLPYLEQYRDRLRRYVVTYMIRAPGIR